MASSGRSDLRGSASRRVRQPEGGPISQESSTRLAIQVVSRISAVNPTCIVAAASVWANVAAKPILGIDRQHAQPRIIFIMSRRAAVSAQTHGAPKPVC